MFCVTHVTSHCYRVNDLPERNCAKLPDGTEVPKSTIGRIEAGLTSPRTDTLMKISRALNIPLIIDGRVQQLDKPSVEISIEYTISDAKIDNDNLSSSNDHFYSSFRDYSEPQRGQYVFENANKQNFDMEERQAKVA